MRAVVLIPWRGGERWREHAWAIVEPYYRSLGYEVYVGDSGSQPFSLAETMNELAVEAGDWDVALFIGADSVMSAEEIAAGLDYAYRHQVVTVPFDRFYSLKEEAVRRPVNDKLPFEDDRSFRAWSNVWVPYYGQTGYLMMPRSVWDRVGGFDGRFKGWGPEDSALLSAAGEFHRLPGTLYHFYHPRAKLNLDNRTLWLDNYQATPAQQYLVADGRWYVPSMGVGRQPSRARWQGVETKI